MREISFLGHSVTHEAIRTPAPDLTALAAAITTGNWSTGLLINDHRHSLNWVGADYLAVDIDGELPLIEAQKRCSASGLAHLIGTTGSHQKPKSGKPACDRYRIIFVLARRITDARDWAATYAQVTGSLDLPADPQARDVVRYWKPCTAIVQRGPGQELAVVRYEPKEIPDAPRPAGLLADVEGALRDIRSWEPAVSGQEGHVITWRLALRLVRGHGLLPEVAAELLAPWNQRCDPPWSPVELLHKCQDAAERGQVPWGFMFYAGTTAEVLRRALRKYGPAGSAGVPYRVWPDGRMLRLDAEDAILYHLHEISKEAGRESTVPSLRQALEWWRAKVQLAGDVPRAVRVGDAGEPALVTLHLEEGPTPAWDEFLDRLDDPQAFLAWVWMLTLPTATRQVLWLQGDGHDGKSVVSTVLREELGGAAVALTDEDIEHAPRWVGGNVYGRRLVVMDDTKNARMLQRGLIHRLTGSGSMTCERKMEPSFSYTANVAILATSNFSPEVSRGAADKTRILPLTVRNRSIVPDSGWAFRLHSEFPALLARAAAAYTARAVAPGEPAITVAGAVQENLTAAHESDDEAYTATFARTGLRFDPTGEITSQQWTERLAMAGLDAMKNGMEVGRLKRWVQTKGAKPQRRSDGTRVLRGMSLPSAPGVPGVIHRAPNPPRETI